LIANQSVISLKPEKQAWGNEASLKAVTNDQIKNFATSLTLYACVAATPQQLCDTYGAVLSR
jgi:hypothetical protein